MLRYVKLRKNDVANGVGVRVTLFVSGCEFACKGCFNPESWDFNAGKIVDEDVCNEIDKELSKDYINGLTILGGEPLHPKNVSGVAKVLKFAKEKHPDKSYWIYSGFTIEALVKRAQNDKDLMYVLQNISVLVDGLFVEELKNANLRFKGSENQRLLDRKDIDSFLKKESQ